MPVKPELHCVTLLFKVLYQCLLTSLWSTDQMLDQTMIYQFVLFSLLEIKLWVGRDPCIFAFTAGPSEFRSVRGT